MRFCFCIVLLLTPAVMLATDAQITFKGVPLGVSEREFTQTQVGYRCSAASERMKAYSDRSCTLAWGDGTFAGVPARINAYFYEDKLASVSVTVSASKFDDVLAALVERFGKPDTLENAVVRNRMGAEFLNVTAVWNRGGVSLLAERYGIDLDQGSIAYQTNWGLEEYRKRKDPQRRKAAGDT